MNEPGDERRGPLRVVLADDHFVVRLGLRAALEDEPGVEVVGEATNGREAVELCAERRPDVALLDVNMPGLDGVEAARAILAAGGTRVLMLTVTLEEAAVDRAIDAGVTGFLLKACEPEILIEALREVAAGGRYFPAEVAKVLATRDERPDLSEREREVLKLMAAGASNKEIAAALHLAEPTVKHHVGGVLRKLGALDRTQAVTRAIARGLVRL